MVFPRVTISNRRSLDRARAQLVAAIPGKRAAPIISSYIFAASNKGEASQLPLVI